MDHQHSVLLLVDIQPDFMPGGALAVEGGAEIVAPVRRLMESDRFGLLVATQDWHPPGHISFASSHPGRKPFETLELHVQPQTLWPDHCVQGSAGARLYAELPWDRVAAIIRKGMDPQTDSYSGFRNNWNANGERPATGLAGYLRERGIREVYVCGLAPRRLRPLDGRGWRRRRISSLFTLGCYPFRGPDGRSPSQTRLHGAGRDRHHHGRTRSISGEFFNPRFLFLQIFQ